MWKQHLIKSLYYLTYVTLHSKQTIANCAVLGQIILPILWLNLPIAIKEPPIFLAMLIEPVFSSGMTCSILPYLLKPTHSFTAPLVLLATATLLILHWEDPLCEILGKTLFLWNTFLWLAGHDDQMIWVSEQTDWGDGGGESLGVGGKEDKKERGRKK